MVLIREADTLEPASQNALLKSLEEPPPGTMFILTTAVPGALLPTVRSRCMRLRFGRLTTAEIAAALIRDHDYSDVDARAGRAARRRQPRPGAGADRQRSVDVPRAGDGTAAAQPPAAPTRSRACRRPAPLHTGGSKKERTREDVAIVLRLMASMLRDLEAINAGADRAVLANPLLTGDLEGAGARLLRRSRPRRVRRRRSRPHRARAQRRHQGRHRVAGRADVMAPAEDRATVGDPAGIGPEIVAKAAADPSVRAVCEPIVFAPPPERAFAPGEVSAAAGRAAYDTIVRAVDAAKRGEVDAIATAPVNKLAFAQAGLEWKGHTDLLAHLCGIERVAMMFHSPQLKVVLITVHVPLSDVSALITPELVDRDDRADRRRDGACSAWPRPRLALAGLNPHAGEGGVHRRRRRSRAGAGGAARPRARRRRSTGRFPATPCSCARRAASSTA